MKTAKKVAYDSKFQYTFQWWAEQIVKGVIAFGVCLLASINF